MTVTVLSAAAVVLLVVRLVLFVHLHLVRRDLSLWSHTVSDLGTGSSRAEFTVMGVLTAVAYGLVLVACVLRDIGPDVPRVFFGVGIVALLVMLCFPTDPTGRSRTAVGAVHWVLAVIQFAGLFVAMVNLDLTPVLPAEAMGVMRWVVRISFYAFLAALLLPALRRRCLGVTERVFLTVTPLWFIVLGTALAAS
ncbi:DUF998 domain-containing protein [Gordonia caeni]|uniref:DUF998 domain-containing protein n=1 Tax=Gordonia caeni TaxID=1007097 RepID=A0ABP7NTD4_9ACTN